MLSLQRAAEELKQLQSDVDAGILACTAARQVRTITRSPELAPYRYSAA